MNRTLPGNLLNAPVAMPRVARNGSVAPVCPVSKSQAVPGTPGALLPLPPRAVDLPTTIMAVNQLTQVLNFLLNPPANINFNLFNTVLGLPKPKWVESGRKMATTRVYNPFDKSMWVDVEHITQLDMTDKIWGQAMTLNYAAPKAGGVGTGPTAPVGGGGAATTPGN